jgi:chromosome partitioning protein
MIIAVTNNKGGVSKTTLTVNAGAALAQLGKRVLIVDLDAQRSAGLSLGVDRDATPTTADVLLNRIPIEDTIQATGAGVDIAPGSFALAHADVSLADVQGREKILRAALSSVRRKYDFILIDTPPSLGLVVVNAIAAADAVLVPLVPHYLVLEGLSNLLEALEKIRAGIGGGELLGIVLSMCDYRQAVTREVVDAVRGHFKRKVFDTEIRVNVRLVEAPSFHAPVTTYAARSTGAENYMNLAREIIQRTK